MSEQSQRHALSILNVLLTWLVQAGYLAGNPLALRRRKTVTRPVQVSRFLPKHHWELMRATIEELPSNTPRLAKRAARFRWLFSLLYIGGLRLSEVCNHSMEAFYCRRGTDGRDRWWLEICGKGEKTRLVPATDELVSELMRYRVANQLTPLPRAGENLPLLLPCIGVARPMARSAVHELVKEIVRETATRLRALGTDQEVAATRLEMVSAHWIRHTSGTHQSDNMDLKAVRDNLGHANISTTSIYLHTEDDARHDQTSKFHKSGWSSH